MAPPGGIVEALVHQHGDPFACDQALVHDRIDAGSPRSEGLSRDVIENDLVTRCRSTKENELTERGAPGTGLVGLFACKPAAVTVDALELVSRAPAHTLTRDDGRRDQHFARRPVDAQRLAAHPQVLDPRDRR